MQEELSGKFLSFLFAIDQLKSYFAKSANGTTRFGLNIDSILKFIHENIEEKNIFIFCYDGINISALIVALYVIKYGGVSTDTIRDILRSKNESICLDFDLSMF